VAIVAEKRIDLRIAWAVFWGIVTRIERDIGTSIDCNSAGICRDIGSDVVRVSNTS
jgi:hypothetical protein